MNQPQQNNKQLREELEEILPVGLDDWLFEEIVSFIEKKLATQRKEILEEVRKEVIGKDEQLVYKMKEALIKIIKIKYKQFNNFDEDTQKLIMNDIKAIELIEFMTPVVDERTKKFTKKT